MCTHPCLHRAFQYHACQPFTYSRKYNKYSPKFTHARAASHEHTSPSCSFFPQAFIAALLSVACSLPSVFVMEKYLLTIQVPSYNTLQHATIHCSTLPHTTSHCNTLPHTATHCNTLQTDQFLMVHFPFGLEVLFDKQLLISIFVKKCIIIV